MSAWTALGAVPHVGYIVAAYLVTAAVVGGAVLAVLLDRRALRRTLERLEARAARGRTGAGGGAAP